MAVSEIHIGPLRDWIKAAYGAREYCTNKDDFDLVIRTQEQKLKVLDCGDME